MFFWKSASIVQNSSGLNAFISRSFSITSLRVELCTLPALRPFCILLARSGESLYPTIRSSKRLVCCASTESISILRGVSSACCMADLVIS